MPRRRPTGCRVPAVKWRGRAATAVGALPTAIAVAVSAVAVAAVAVVAVAVAALGSPGSAVAGAGACPGWGRPAIAADPHPHALRVFAIQFEQQPGSDGAPPPTTARAIDCAIRTEVLPRLARGRPNLVVFDEDIGLETIAIGPRGAAARARCSHAALPACARPGLAVRNAGRARRASTTATAARSATSAPRLSAASTRQARTRLRGRHRRVRARVHDHDGGRGPPLRDLRDRLQHPGAVPHQPRSGGDHRAGRSRDASAPVGLCAHRRRRLRPDLRVGPARPPPPAAGAAGRT